MRIAEFFRNQRPIPLKTLTNSALRSFDLKTMTSHIQGPHIPMAQWDSTIIYNIISNCLPPADSSHEISRVRVCWHGDLLYAFINWDHGPLDGGRQAEVRNGRGVKKQLIGSLFLLERGSEMLTLLTNFTGGVCEGEVAERKNHRRSFFTKQPRHLAQKSLGSDQNVPSIIWSRTAASSYWNNSTWKFWYPVFQKVENWRRNSAAAGTA